MFIQIEIDKGAIGRGQQDKGLKHKVYWPWTCRGSHMATFTNMIHKSGLDLGQEEWWFHKSRVRSAVEDVVRCCL